MRKQNAVSDFTKERNLEILNLFRERLANRSEDALDEMFQKVPTMDASRFWVSESRAARIVGQMLAGEDPTINMYEEKKEMYSEIYRRFLRLREKEPHRSIQSLVEEVVNQPAPRHYISWQRARVLIYQQRRQNRIKKNRT